MAAPATVRALPESTPDEPRGRRWHPIARTREILTNRPHVTASILLIGVVAAVVFLNDPGWYVADARYEHSADPLQFLRRHAYIWDAERNPGEPAPYFSPVVATFQAGVQALGAAPWVIERATHMLYLSVAGVGALVLSRRLLPGRTLAHVIAGVVYAFSPFTAQFLAPSGLFVPYALAPWLLLFCLRGIEERDPWRWAAWFALAIFSVGMLNSASLVYALVPLVVFSIGSVLHARTATWRSLWAWTWRAALLTVGVAAAMFVVLGLVAEEIRTNLETTELPETVARTSSAGESWRGLGLWLSYLRLSGEPVRSQAAAYFSNPLVIAATFVLPFLAGLGYWLGRFRHRAALGVLVAVSIVLMIGIHPPDSSAPLGRLLDHGYDNVAFLRSFRSTYKAGVGLQLGIAVLVGVGCDELRRRRRRGPSRFRRFGVAFLLAVLAVGYVGSVYPFWTGNLYSPEDRFETLPDYWDQAFAWFEDQPQDGRVLVVPGVTRARYRWGYVNDNLFDTHLAKPLAMHQALPQGTAEVADVIAALDDHISSGAYTSGSIGPVLRRLGIRWLLVQNDLDWQALGLTRPNALQALGNDPDLELVAGFGRLGENTTDPDDALARLTAEGELRPVQVYQVRAAPGPVRLTQAQPVLVSGGGEAWPALGRKDYLGYPVQNVSSAEPDQVARLLETGSPAIITDGNRRRATRVTTVRNRRSHTLTPTESVGREPQTVFPEIESQTIATHGDVRSVTATRYGPFESSWTTWWRPAMALDGDPHTAWAVNGGQEARGEILRIELAEPQSVTRLGILPYAEEPTRRLMTEIEVRTTDTVGQVFSHRVSLSPIDLDAMGELAIDRDDVTTIELQILDEVALGDQAVGISDLEIRTPDGVLDGREFLRTPSDLDAAAQASEEVASALVDAPVSYVFTRWRGVGRSPEETEIRREFLAPHDDVLTLEAGVRISGDTPDQVIDELIGAPAGAYGSSRFSDALSASGQNTIDGNVNTAWQVEPSGRDRLVVRLPDRAVDRLEIDTVVAPRDPTAFSRVRTFDVVVAGVDGVQRTSFDTPVRVECEQLVATDQGPGCTETWSIELPETRANTITITLRRVDVTLGLLRTRPVRVAEVRPFLGDQNVLELQTLTGAVGCRPFVELDGEPVELLVDRALTIRLLGEGVELRSCQSVGITDEWHRIETTPALRSAVIDLELRPHDLALTLPPRPGNAEIVESSPTDLEVRVDGTDGEFLLTDIPRHDGWELRADGAEVAPLSLDGNLAWRLPATGTTEVSFSFAPQRTYELAWIITGTTLAVCVWLILPRRRRRT